jgi:hypothetical protein
VRYENVIKAGSAYKDCYCGHCNHTWTLSGTNGIVQPRESAGDKPEPSRAG